MKQGLVLLAHGARDPSWAAPFEAVAELVRAQRPGVPVTLAFLEFLAPDLAEAAARLVHAGCTRVVVQPMFLGTGGHVRRDLPRLMQALHESHPAIRFEMPAAIGELPQVHRVMAEAAAALLAPGAMEEPR
jgi:sirohydrochlorin cobaltochelatase